MPPRKKFQEFRIVGSLRPIQLERLYQQLCRKGLLQQLPHSAEAAGISSSHISQTPQIFERRYLCRLQLSSKSHYYSQVSLHIPVSVMKILNKLIQQLVREENVSA